MADLNTDVRYIKGVGEAKAKALGKLGIATLGDLIAWFPHRYEDRRETKPVSQLIPGETACVAAMIAAEPKLSHIRKGMDLVKVRAVDDTGVLDVTFFNQPWLKNQLHVGETYIFYGKAEGSLLRKNMAGPIVEPEANNIIITPICAHEVGSRCIVASDRRVVTVEMVRNARRNAYVSVDGGRAFRLNLGDVVTIQKSHLETKLVRLKERSFYDVVNAKFKKV